MSQYNQEEVLEYINGWAKYWNNPKTKIKVLEQLKQVADFSDYKVSELKDLILTKLRQDKEKVKKGDLEIKERARQEELEKKENLKSIAKRISDEEKAEKEKVTSTTKANKEQEKKDKDKTKEAKKKLEEIARKEEFLKGKEINNELANKIFQAILREDFDDATELMVKEILSKEHISTLRHDKKPELWIYKEGIVIPQGESYIAQSIRNVLGKGYTKTYCNSVINKIITDTYIDEREFFKEEPSHLIPVANGIYDREKKELLPFSSEYRFFNKAQPKYDPNATCPKILDFFKSILEYEEDIKIMQESFGFVLERDYFIEKGNMWKGDGRNGKTKALDLMKRFIGEDNCVEIPLQDLEKDNFALSELHKKMVNISGDLSSEALNHTGNFKKLTGRDLVSGARKFLTRISFVNYAKQFFACNILPRTKDLSPAFFLRWVTLNFPYTFLPQKEINAIPECDREKVKLQNSHIIEDITSEEELSGLLNWALEGLDRLIKNKDFSFSKTTQDIKLDWLRASNSVEGFVMDICEVDYMLLILKDEFHMEYAKYCSKNKLRIQTEKVIKESLEEKGIYEVRKYISDGTLYGKEQKRFWCGINIKEDLR